MALKQVRTAKGLGALFISAGLVQLTHRELFEELVPARFAEYAGAIQAVTQAALVGVGVSYFVPRLGPVARWGSMSLLAANLIAAVDHVAHPQQTDRLGLPRGVVAACVPIQIGAMVAAWHATKLVE